jgi:hypothetical protein
MLSWSMSEAGHPVTVDALASPIADGVAGFADPDGAGSLGLPHERELVRFASAAAGFDEVALRDARAQLVDAAGEAFMVDAAAVVANFEMMTRVADGTGARFPSEVVGISDSAMWASHR